MSLIIGFVYITFLSFIVVCGYFGIKAIVNKIKKDGFVKFLESFFYVFVAIALVYLLSVRVGNSFMPEPKGLSHRIQHVI